MRVVADNMTSVNRIMQYGLGAPSSIHLALQNLASEDKLNLILTIGKSYVLQDKMFELWIAKKYGKLDMKYNCSKE